MPNWHWSLGLVPVVPDRQGDSPFCQSRVWYGQFSDPRAKAPEIVARIAGKHYAKGMPPFGLDAAE